MRNESSTTSTQSNFILKSKYHYAKNKTESGSIPQLKFPVRSTDHSDCLYTKLRGFLMLGALLGLVPIQGLFKTNTIGLDHLRLRYFRIQSLLSMVMFATLTFNLSCIFIALVASRESTFKNIIYCASYMCFYTHGIFHYVYYFRNSKRLIKLFKFWRFNKLHFTKEDIKLGKYVFVTVVIIFTSATIDNFNKDYWIMKSYPSQSKPLLEYFYTSAYHYWRIILDYNPILCLFIFTSEQICWYAWHYSDIFIAVIGRAMYFKFKTLIEVAQTNLKILRESKDKNKELIFWKHVAEDHDTLCRMLVKLADFYSPIIFATYVIFIFYLSLAIGILANAIRNHYLSDDLLFTLWSVMHLGCRVFHLTLNTAKVNKFANEIQTLFLDCPNEFYVMDVKRTVQRIVSRPIGFHGLETFYITKQFFLTLLSVLFTVQIVVLQFVPLSEYRFQKLGKEKK